MLLCLVLVFRPYFEKKQQKAPAVHGIGGGRLSEEMIAGAESGFSESLESLEFDTLEPESFSKARVLLCDTYVVQRGDMISNLAIEFGLNQDTLISVNAIKNTRLLQTGQILKIPNQDGIYYTVRSGDTLDAIAEKNKTELNSEVADHVASLNNICFAQ